MQVQFLPFHSSFITWTQRISLFADLDPTGVAVAQKSCPGASHWSSRFRWLWSVIGVVLGARASCCSLGRVATFPGEWQEGDLPSWPILPADQVDREPQRDAIDAARSTVALGVGQAILGLDFSKCFLHDWVCQLRRTSRSEGRGDGRAAAGAHQRPPLKTEAMGKALERAIKEAPRELRAPERESGGRHRRQIGRHDDRFDQKTFSDEMRGL